MRSQEEITRLNSQLDSLIVTLIKSKSVALHSAMLHNLSAISLTLEWVLGTEEGDKLPLLVTTVKNIQTQRTELN